jgi:hypothetical protein
MLAARFITKGIGDFVQIEAAIDNWLDVGSVKTMSLTPNFKVGKTFFPTGSEFRCSRPFCR